MLTRAAYVKSAWNFEFRAIELAEPTADQLLVEVHACGVCGTDQHIADRTALEWQSFGHEAAGVVRAIGADVTRFKVGDRVALDSSAPCGTCHACLPQPYGRGRADLCPQPTSYWAAPAMGFSKHLIAPQAVAVAVPAHVSLDHACLVEPLGVCIDLVQVAEVSPNDHVLVIGPGPLGLGAVYMAQKAGAAHITLAGRASSQARMNAGIVLGADRLIEVDKTPLSRYDFGAHPPNKILVTAPPNTLPEAISIAAHGGVIAYIGIAWDASNAITLDADAFHFKKLQLRASHAWPGTHANESLRWLATDASLGATLVTHHFGLDDIERAMTTARDQRDTAIKVVVTPLV
jgi:L-iditol 2-dehydrogenase